MDENIRKVTHVQNIRYDKVAERLYIIDQTLLPNEEREIELRTPEEMVEAIKKGSVVNRLLMLPEASS